MEDQPAGWDRIDRIRISPWRGGKGTSTLVLHALSTRRDTILVVRGTSSATGAGEAALAAGAAARVSRWLTDLGIDHGGIDDQAVEAGGLAGSKLAILAYNPRPSPAAVTALRSFIEQGGKLIVFGSASSALARVMGLELGTHTVSHEPGRWAAMRFSEPETWKVPARVHETAWSLIPARPSAAGTEVIARWERADGQSTPDPACLASPAGFWFCHLPRGDDPQGKRELLLGLMAHHDSTLWPWAARHALDAAGRVGPFPDLPAAFAHIRARVPGAQRPRAASQLEKTAERHRELAAAFAAGRYREVVQGSPRLAGELALAYALTSEARPGERRGVWDHDGVGLFPGDWDRTTRRLAGLGITAVFPNLAWGGLAHYPSRVLPGSNTLRLHGDQLGQCLRAAHARGLEVHVWKICWNLSNAPADFRDRLRAEGRLQRDRGGASLDWLCPSHPANRRLEIEALKEMAGQYEIDGIHLDYIRYPGAGACYCRGCRERFETESGAGVTAWPEDVTEGRPRYRAFLDWRAGQITALVREASRVVRPLRPGLRLSAAVFRSYPSCRESVGQDWKLWLDRGYLDFVCPMNYTDSTEGFRATTRLQVTVSGDARRLVPGIGVLSGESQLGPAETAAQVVAARELGAGGFVFFDLGPTLADDILPFMGFPATRP